MQLDSLPREVFYFLDSLPLTQQADLIKHHSSFAGVKKSLIYQWCLKQRKRDSDSN
jgi:hypothetical protein